MTFQHYIHQYLDMFTSNYLQYLRHHAQDQLRKIKIHFGPKTSLCESGDLMIISIYITYFHLEICVREDTLLF